MLRCHLLNGGWQVPRVLEEPVDEPFLHRLTRLGNGNGMEVALRRFTASPAHRFLDSFDRRALLLDVAVGLFGTEDARGGINAFLESGAADAAFAGR